MASIDTGGGGKKGGGKKPKQKKQNLRVDFTPMVDMNMLLITFFMFATSLAKPQTMEITLPARDTDVHQPKPELSKDLAFTIMLGSNHQVFYFAGMPTFKPEDLSVTDFSADGLRAILLEKNADVVAQIKDLKEKRKNKEISDDEFTAQSIEIKKKARLAPNVIIKASENATFRDLVDALDEMLITNIVLYTIAEMTPQDVEWLRQAEAMHN